MEVQQEFWVTDITGGQYRGNTKAKHSLYTVCTYVYNLPGNAR